jgi:hypothetical protein
MKKRLKKIQKRILDEMFFEDIQPDDALEKYNITKADFAKWLTNEPFVEYCKTCLLYQRINSSIVLCRYVTYASSMIIKHSQSEKPEISLRACLMIIDIVKGIYNSSEFKNGRVQYENENVAAGDKMADGKDMAMDDETATKLLALLAKEQK